MLQPWKIVKSETVVEKYGKEFRLAKFLNPSTNKEEEFTLYGQKDWSTILPITTDGNVVAARQFKHGSGKILVELPGGTADFEGEDPEAVADRELLEETGYKAEKIIKLGPAMYMSSRNSWTRFHAFLGINCRKVKSIKVDPSEEIEVVLMPYEQWIDFCHTVAENPCDLTATFRAMKYYQP